MRSTFPPSALPSYKPMWRIRHPKREKTQSSFQQRPTKERKVHSSITSLMKVQNGDSCFPIHTRISFEKWAIETLSTLFLSSYQHQWGRLFLLRLESSYRPMRRNHRPKREKTQSSFQQRPTKERKVFLQVQKWENGKNVKRKPSKSNVVKGTTSKKKKLRHSFSRPLVVGRRVKKILDGKSAWRV